MPHEGFNIISPPHFKCTPLTSPQHHSQLSPSACSQFQLLNRKVLNYWLLSLWRQASKDSPQAQDLESKEELNWKAPPKSLESEELWWPASLSQAVHRPALLSYSPVCSGGNKTSPGTQLRGDGTPGRRAVNLPCGAWLMFISFTALKPEKCSVYLLKMFLHIQNFT